MAKIPTTTEKLEKEIELLQIRQKRLLAELKVEVNPKCQAILKAELNKIKELLTRHRNTVRVIKAKQKPLEKKQADKHVRTK